MRPGWSSPCDSSWQMTGSTKKAKPAPHKESNFKLCDYQATCLTNLARFAKTERVGDGGSHVWPQWTNIPDLRQKIDLTRLEKTGNLPAAREKKIFKKTNIHSQSQLITKLYGTPWAFFFFFLQKWQTKFIRVITKLQLGHDRYTHLSSNLHLHFCSFLSPQATMIIYQH